MVTELIHTRRQANSHHAETVPKRRRKNIFALRGEDYLSSEFKGKFDRFFGTLGLILIPVSNHFAKRVIAEDGGPAYYEEIRVGQHGQPILTRKLRTMGEGAVLREKDFVNRQHANGDDPRATKIGKFLRRAKIDEIEQLRAVANGTLGFIGPRIFKQASIERIYDRLVLLHGPREGRRLFYDWLFNGYNITKPGLVDPSAARSEDSDDELGRLEKQIEYGMNAGLIRDLGIIGETVSVISGELVRVAKRRLARSIGLARQTETVESEA